LRVDREIRNVVKQIIQRVKDVAVRDTRYIHVVQNKEVIYHAGQTSLDKCIYYLKQSLPDSVIDYREATDLMGKTTGGIFIDWS
jgi:hypothetical protein